jgi:hypothetical protein
LKIDARSADIDFDGIKFFGDALPSCIVSDNASAVAVVKTKTIGS